MGIDVIGYNNAHQMGESATHSIARFLDHWALLLLLAWNSHAASSRLAQRPKKRTLECVQLRFLGNLESS